MIVRDASGQVPAKLTGVVVRLWRGYVVCGAAAAGE